MTEETATGAFNAQRDGTAARGRAGRGRRLRAWYKLALFAAVAGALGLLALTLLLGLFLDQATECARSAVTSTAELVGDWFSHYEPSPYLLARDPRVVAVMTNDAESADLGWLNQELEVWKDYTQASDIYLMAPDGTTVAASKAETDVSFVGQNFAYRPYFQQPMEGETGRLFALGTTSGLRGYYLSAPIQDGPNIVGSPWSRFPSNRWSRLLPALRTVRS